jgi:hypothetical protein
MAVWRFSQSSALRGKIVDPSWYVLLIQEHRDWTPTKAGDSNNCYFDCIIECDADTGDTKYAGVPIELMFNDKPKAEGFREAFMKALGAEVVFDKDYNMNAAVGKRIEAFVENSEWNGRISNKCNHKYRPAKK